MANVIESYKKVTSELNPEEATNILMFREQETTIKTLENKLSTLQQALNASTVELRVYKDLFRQLMKDIMDDRN